MTNQPLRGAKLEIGKIKIMSDSNGNFRFPFIDLSKPVQVKISYKKQAVMERTISVYSDQTILYYNPYTILILDYSNLYLKKFGHLLFLKTLMAEYLL
jgi:hypothetical protein